MRSLVTSRRKSLVLAVCYSLSIILGSSGSAYALEPSSYSRNDILYYDPNAATCSADPGASSTDGAGAVLVDKGFDLGTDKQARPVELAKKLMQDYNWTDFQAAGVVGNFMVESGDDWVPPDYNEGDHSGSPPRFNGGYGWAQWTGGRQTAFIDFAVSKGYMKSRADRATDAANYAYLNKELTNSSESKVVPALKAAKTVSEAVVTWERVFERAGVPALGARLDDANKVLKALNGSGKIESVSGTTAAADPTAASGCAAAQSTAASTSSANFGDVTFPLQGSKSVVKNPEIFKNNTTQVGGHPYTAYDIYAPAGTKVIAFAAGVVKQISNDKCGSRLVGIYNQKADAIVSYMHLNATDNVKMGTTVKPGDFVGTVASLKQYPCVNVEHLHIDVEKGSVRDACARESCAESVKKKFIDIGPDLYNAYQKVGS